MAEQVAEHELKMCHLARWWRILNARLRTEELSLYWLNDGTLLEVFGQRSEFES